MPKRIQTQNKNGTNNEMDAETNKQANTTQASSYQQLVNAKRFPSRLFVAQLIAKVLACLFLLFSYFRWTMTHTPIHPHIHIYALISTLADYKYSSIIYIPYIYMYINLNVKIRLRIANGNLI